MGVADHILPLGDLFFFLVADTQLYKRLCPSVRRSVGWLVGRSVHHARVEKWENTHFRPCPPIRNWWPCIRPCSICISFQTSKGSFSSGYYLPRHTPDNPSLTLLEAHFMAEDSSHLIIVRWTRRFSIADLGLGEPQTHKLSLSYSCCLSALFCLSYQLTLLG